MYCLNVFSHMNSRIDPACSVMFVGRIPQHCKTIKKKKISLPRSDTNLADFHQLCRVGLVDAMPVCLFTCLSPSHAILLRGRTGAEHASLVDWCNLNFNLE